MDTSILKEYFVFGMLSFFFSLTIITLSIHNQMGQTTLDVSTAAPANFVCCSCLYTF